MVMKHEMELWLSENPTTFQIDAKTWSREWYHDNSDAHPKSDNTKSIPV